MHHELITVGMDDRFSQLTSNPDVIVRGDPEIQDNYIIVFFDLAPELTKTEQARITRLSALARVVKEDTKYGDLKNATQRRLFLLTRYGINSHDAEDVIALIDPVMECIVNGQ